jgi:hypothetical protein
VTGIHPILNNGFLRPQVVPRAANANASAKSVTLSAASASASSMSPTAPGNNKNTAAAQQRLESLLGSKSARDAFFERLRVTECLGKAGGDEWGASGAGRVGSAQSSSNSSSDRGKFVELLLKEMSSSVA